MWGVCFPARDLTCIPCPFQVSEFASPNPASPSLPSSPHRWQLKLYSLCEAVSSVRFSRSVVSNSLQPHGRQHARPAYAYSSPAPRSCSNSSPSSRRCHPTLSSSVFPFSSCPLSFPASGSFPVSRLFASGGQNIRSRALRVLRTLPPTVPD